MEDKSSVCRRLDARPSRLGGFSLYCLVQSGRIVITMKMQIQNLLLSAIALFLFASCLCVCLCVCSLEIAGCHAVSHPMITDSGERSPLRLNSFCIINISLSFLPLSSFLFSFPDRCFHCVSVHFFIIVMQCKTLLHIMFEPP